MTDPELQALAEPMFDALMDRKPLDRRAQAEICAVAAVDFFAARLARADAIEQAAREVVAQHRAGPSTEYHTPCALCARTWPCATHEVLRAALEAS